MIRARGAAAYFDAEWIPSSGSDDVPSLVVESNGTVRLGDAWKARAPEGVEAEVTAASVLDSIAAGAVAAAKRHAPPGPIRVTGCGAVAARAEEILSERDRAAGDRPAAIIDTTGDPSVIAKTTEELVDLGVLVLAGMPPRTALSLNLYPDVHVRGLRIVGAGPTSAAGPAGATSGAREPLSALFGNGLTELGEGSVLGAPAGWYRTSAKDVS